MSASIPGSRELPGSRHDLATYWGRVKHSADLADPRTLFTSSTGLESAKSLLQKYKSGQQKTMTPELWRAKKIVDSTLHPDTGTPIFLPFRMSSYVLTNLIVTAGMLQPNLSTRATLSWQIANQTLNVLINASNANKTSPIPPVQLATSFVLAVSASCGVALGLGRAVAGLKVRDGRVSSSPGVSPGLKVVLGRLVPFVAVVTAGVLNVGLMRGGEITAGIDIYPSPSPSSPSSTTTTTTAPQPLGKSRKAALLAVTETAISRVTNATPIMVIPPLILYNLQKRIPKLQNNPRFGLGVNIGLIFITSIFALPLALAIFPQRRTVDVTTLEREFWEKVPGRVEFNRGI